jgi:hypothetical protein
LNFVSGFSGGAGIIEIADGYIMAGNDYDNRMYVYGKGPSATTVAASPKVSVHGSGVLIEGMVTDESPGAKEFSQSRGLNVPAIADADQQAWMEYMYLQQAMPTSAKGVEVSLDAIDPNNNFVHIATVTSDSSGMYKKMFTPEVPGEYTIIATFAGSESYYSSYAETALGVSPAPETTPPPETPPAPDFTPTIVGTGIVIIAAVAVVGFLLFRKK